MHRDDLKHQFDPEERYASLQETCRKLTKENTNLKKQVGTDFRLFEEIKDHIKSFPEPEKIKFEVPKGPSKKTELVASITITDTHSEELVRTEEMEGLAFYDFNTFLYRLNLTAEKVLEEVNFMRNGYVIRKLVIKSLGDWFCGKIQPQEEAYAITMPMPKAVPAVGKAFGKFLVNLCPHFDEIEVVGMCGNHGRDTAKPVFKMTADRNWDMSVYLIAQGYTEQCENIKWTIPQSIMHVIDILGWKCLLTHSGEVNMNNRTPYYPIESTADMEHKARSGTDKDFDYFEMGHWHHYAVLDGSIILSPSMIGANQFSRFKLHRRSAPEQLLTFFDEKDGMRRRELLRLN